MSKVTVKEGKAKESIVNPDGTETNTEEVVTSDKYTAPTANVGFSGGFTRNMGDYNSMRVQVSINLPCYVEEIDTIADFAEEWVDNRLNAIQEKLDSGELS